MRLINCAPGYFGASELKLIDVPTKQNNYNYNIVLFYLLMNILKKINL